MKFVYLIAIFVLSILALLSKKYTGFGEEIISSYFADVMAVAIIYLFILSISTISKIKIGVGVFGLALVIELSQLIQLPLLTLIRSNYLGQIVLGGTFDIYDIFAYGLGVIFAFLTDRIISM